MFCANKRRYRQYSNARSFVFSAVYQQGHNKVTTVRFHFSFRSFPAHAPIQAAWAIGVGKLLLVVRTTVLPLLLDLSLHQVEVPGWICYS
jgi:hypothetical protein